MPDIKNIFISHKHEDDAGCQKLKDLLKKNGMEARDYSITKDKPNQAKNEDYIKTNILGPQIQQASCLVVYLTKSISNNDKWIEWEVNHARELGKRIVAVYAHGEQECEVPDYIHRFAHARVGWTGDNIIKAINGNDIFEKEDGSPLPEIHPKPHIC